MKLDSFFLALRLPTMPTTTTPTQKFSPAARAAIIAANKTKSLTVKKPVRVTVGEEHFVFESGILVEYEMDVPDDDFVDFKAPKKAR